MPVTLSVNVPPDLLVENSSVPRMLSGPGPIGPPRRVSYG